MFDTGLELKWMFSCQRRIKKKEGRGYNLASLMSDYSDGVLRMVTQGSFEIVTAAK